jgi:hypothetical protein
MFVPPSLPIPIDPYLFACFSLSPIPTYPHFCLCRSHFIYAYKVLDKIPVSVV